MEHPTTQQYRGTSFDVGFIPRTRLEIVVPDQKLDTVVNCLLKAAVGAVFVYVFGSMLIIFFIIKKVVGLRVSDAEQLEGLDLGEHGNIAYGGFVLESTGLNAIISGHQIEKGNAWLTMKPFYFR